MTNNFSISQFKQVHGCRQYQNRLITCKTHVKNQALLLEFAFKPLIKGIENFQYAELQEVFTSRPPTSRLIGNQRLMKTIALDIARLVQ